MNRRTLLSSALFALAMLPGCTPPALVPVVERPTVAVLAAPRDQVWPALVAVVGIGFPIQAIEKDSGLISTRPATMLLPASQWALGCEDPNDFANPWNRLRMDLRVLAEDGEAGKTQITIICHYEAFKQSTFPREWTVVASNGALEQELLKKIQQRLPRP